MALLRREIVEAMDPPHCEAQNRRDCMSPDLPAAMSDIDPGDTDARRALAVQASRRVVQNHLDTIRIVYGQSGELASILGVSPALITRWSGEQLPDLVDRDRIRRFADLVSLLLQRFVPAAAADWFSAPNVDPRDGGGTPLDLLREGKWDVLRTYAEEAVSEAYG